MAFFRLGEVMSSPENPDFQDFLAAAHGERARPLCLCTPAAPPMYVARALGRYLIKRMPMTGADHDSFCDSFEPPAELSGLGQVNGSAIQENAEDGITTLKFAFPLSKGRSRKAGPSEGAEADSVKADASRLSLRGALHYLWEEAGLNRWSPRMAGKRSWFVVRKYVLEASEGKQAKGVHLGEMLYLPEAFSAERKGEIAQRRHSRVMAHGAPRAGARPLMILVGEVKEIQPSRYGFRLLARHAPDFPFMLPEDLHRRLSKRFATELEMWSAGDDFHLMVIATFGMSLGGVATIEEAAVMVTNAAWIPLETGADKLLLDTLMADGRRFTRGLRYNLPPGRPLATAVLSDAQGGPTALYILPAGASPEYSGALEELIEHSQLAAWVWKEGEARPVLPLAATLRPERARL